MCCLWYLCCFSLELVHELEQIRAKLQESNDRIAYMDEEFSTARHSLEAENIRLLDELEKLNDKYNRFGVIVSQDRFKTWFIINCIHGTYCLISFCW